MFFNEVTTYSRIKGWHIIGKSQKRSGEIRDWTASCTGRYAKGKYNDRFLEVFDLNKKQIRWLNLESFCGTIGKIQLENGQRIDGRQGVLIE
jgi:hypothetical protein